MRKIVEVMKLEEIPRGTAQQRKLSIVNGRAMSYPSKTLAHARAVYAYQFAKLGRPKEPFKGPCKLTLAFVFGTKEKKKIREHWKTTKPDCDNLAKVFIDALNHNGFLSDDNQISSLSVSKWWDSESKILFELEELTDG